LFELGRGHWLAEVITLRLLAAHSPQQFGRVAVLDALGDDGQAQRPAEAYDSGDNRRVAGILANVAHKGLVDLEPVEWEFLEVGQARLAGAEIVERNVDAKLPDPPENLQCRLVVLQHDIFRDLEFQQTRRQAGFAELRCNGLREVA
jgi:hypothetical protein